MDSRALVLQRLPASEIKSVVVTGDTFDSGAVQRAYPQATGRRRKPLSIVRRRTLSAI